MSSKRLDLQGIRGLAILSVLGFHFYPHLFPNGYLGVDQFFVLSGFLMCMLLSKTEHLPVCSGLLHFYSRRFKRILPLYLLVLLLTLSALYTVFPETAVLQNQSSASKALFFVSNRVHTGEEDYFEKLSLAIDLFTHTWSLSVEIQFYFLVPAIFLIGNLFGNTLKYGYYLLLGVTSFSYNLTSPKSVAFNSVFARIWQFLVGMLIYLASTKATTSPELPYKILRTKGENGKKLLEKEDEFDLSEEEEEEEGELIERPEVSPSVLGRFSKYFFLIPMAYIVSYPLELSSVILRPVFTLFTGCLMLLSADDVYLSNPILTYIGDISYSLYLVHWPIYSYCKLEYPGNQYVLTAGLLGSVLLAVLVYETFEKWYLKLSNVSISIIVLILFASNVVLTNKDVIRARVASHNPHNFTRLDGVLPNMTFDDAERLNNLWTATDLGGLREPGCIKRTPGKVWCDFEEKGKEFKLAIFGNSLTENHHKMFLQECRSRAYNVTMYSEYGCEPLAALPNEGHCKNHLKDFVDFLNSTKPDYGFLLTRYFATGQLFKNNVTNLETDLPYLEMRSQMKKFLPHIKKKLFVLDAFPRTNRFYVGTIAKDLKKGRNLALIHNALVDPDETWKLARLRTEAVVKECGSKCELIDYQPLLFNNSTRRFEFFDEKGFSYFSAVNHLSAHGMELVRPIYTEICQNLS